MKTKEQYLALFDMFPREQQKAITRLMLHNICFALYDVGENDKAKEISQMVEKI